MFGIDAAAGLFSSALSSMFGANSTKSSNSSDNINSSDFLSAYEAQTQQKTSDMVKSLDKNGDGTLSIDESGMSKQAFSAIDTNGDGQLDSNELNAAYVKQDMLTSAQNLMKTYDTNGDGKLTATELRISQQDFAALDTTGSGAIGIHELMDANPMKSLYEQYASTANIFTTNPANTLQGLNLTA
ncbi:MAG: EF-hand domain-containing protein [Candidatus Magnetominusculus sp. LBB02]|nr:EF-hand domain-containing protein [Candidatus Magnetominusculus sp. LBB02]